VFVKSGRYYSDVEGVKTAATKATLDRQQYGGRNGPKGWGTDAVPINGGTPQECMAAVSSANPGDVLELSTQPSKIPHYAMYPVRLPLFFMRWLMPRLTCSTCGKPWRRHVAKGELIPLRGNSTAGPKAEGGARDNRLAAGLADSGWTPGVRETETLSWQPHCTCAAPATGPVILDPYGGPGTTACASSWLWAHPQEGVDTVLADAHMEATRPGAETKFHDGDGSQRPEYAKARMVKTGRPSTVIQPWLEGKAIMLDLDPKVEGFYRDREAECFASLGEESFKAPPAVAPLFDPKLIGDGT
jgi:hypothetical protein